MINNFRSFNNGIEIQSSKSLAILNDHMMIIDPIDELQAENMRIQYL